MSALPPKADIGYVSDLINFQSSIVFFEVSSAPLKICHLTRRLIGGWVSSRQGDDRISWDNDPPYNLIHGNLQRLAVSSRSILRTAKNDGCDRIHTALLSQRQCQRLKRHTFTPMQSPPANAPMDSDETGSCKASDYFRCHLRYGRRCVNRTWSTSHGLSSPHSDHRYDRRRF